MFTTRRGLRQEEQEAWEQHNKGMAHLAAQEFYLALQCFLEILRNQENDHLAQMMVERCNQPMRMPPSDRTGCGLMEAADELTA